MKPICKLCGGKGRIIVKHADGQSWVICRQCKPAKGKLINLAT